MDMFMLADPKLPRLTQTRAQESHLQAALHFLHSFAWQVAARARLAACNRCDCPEFVEL